MNIMFSKISFSNINRCNTWIRTRLRDSNKKSEVPLHIRYNLYDEYIRVDEKNEYDSIDLRESLLEGIPLSHWYWSLLP